MSTPDLRVGIDLGGTKIEGVVMRGDAQLLSRQRIPTPSGDYQGTLEALRQLVQSLEAEAGVGPLPVGCGTPGTVSRATGRMKNCNSTWLNDRPLVEDLEAVLNRPVRIANDADCFALSEAMDGAAAGASSVFAVILGTGVGGGIVLGAQLLTGPNRIAGEWGHNPLPWLRPEWDEMPGPRCWCGQHGCIETWLSGPGLAHDHRRATGEAVSGEAVVAQAEAGDVRAQATLSRYEDRLARALAHVINLLDPEVVVLGGGLSRIERLYRHVPALWDQWIFSDRVETRLLANQHGDSSGVRGAAWLWGR